MSTVSFHQLTLTTDQAVEFLQRQLTVDVKKLNQDYQATAIANIKGRIDLGIWIKKISDTEFNIVTSSDCLEALQAHMNKYGPFSKVKLTEPVEIYPCVKTNSEGVEVATFSDSAEDNNPEQWMTHSIATGNYWIVDATRGMFQPQELRLHQREGVDYDKGCYLGQEVIARIYFKASPKAFLHRVKGSGETPAAGDAIDKIKVVNAIDNADGSGFEALVVARPNQIEESELEVLVLPEALQGSVAREGSE